MQALSFSRMKKFSEKATLLFNENYGKKTRFRIKKQDALDTLVAVILSQNTSDRNSFRAFGNLKRRFRNWKELISADLSEIKKEIRVGGLESIKAERIRSALREIKTRKGNLDLRFLSKMETGEAKEFLTSIKGIGQKSASVVLAFSFGRGLIPVDTHVFRVSKRLGLVGRKATPDKAQKELENMIQEKKRIAFHLNMIRHGREICKAQVPKCSICFLKKICPKVGVKKYQ